MNSARVRAYTELLIVVLIWGIAPAVIKFALAELPPFIFLAYRFLISTVILLPIFLLTKRKGITLSNLPLLILVSLLGSTLNLGLLFLGTNYTTSLDSSLISSTSPIFVVILAVIFFHERITKREKTGIFVAILGTLIVALQSYFEKTPATQSTTYGNFILFLSNLSYALYLLLSKKSLKQKVSPFSITFMMFFVGLITTFPIAVYEAHGVNNLLPMISRVNLSTHLSVAYMAIFSGAIAYFLYQKAQKAIEASEASIFNYLPPIVTAPVGMLWLHEKITWPFVLGSAIIAVGVFMAEWRNSRKKV